MTGTNSGPHDRGITDVSEFESALHELLLTAYERDIDVRGAVPLRNGPGAPDWEVVISELASDTLDE